MQGDGSPVSETGMPDSAERMDPVSVSGWRFQTAHSPDWGLMQCPFIRKFRIRRAARRALKCEASDSRTRLTRIKSDNRIIYFAIGHSLPGIFEEWSLPWMPQTS